MILASQYGNRELRVFELSGLIPPPGSPDAIVGGPLRAPELSVPAVAAAVRLVSEEIGSFVMRVYKGDAEQRQRLLDDQRARLFQEPAEGWTSFDLWQDTITSLELDRHAFLWKSIVKGRVEELYPLDPDYFEVRRVDGRKRIRARIEGVREDVTEKVIHIRSWSPRPTMTGVSTLELHQGPLRTARSYDEFRGAYFDNDGLPGIVLEHPGKPDRNQRREFLEAWVRRHGGPRNTNKPGILWDGLKLHPLERNLKDSQAAEISDSIVRDVARMFRIDPAELLHAVLAGQQQKTPEHWGDIFIRFSCLPRMRRIERAIASDPHVFPEQSWPKPFCRFDVSEFLRGDIATTAAMIHNLVQVGVMTPNEGRAILGLPPVAGGDELQQTPVGGAPNPFPELDDEDELAERLRTWLAKRAARNGRTTPSLIP